MPDLGGPEDREIDTRQPEWVCLQCAEQEGGHQHAFVAAWNMIQCDCCGRKTACAQPRYWGMLSEGWEKRIVRVKPAEAPE